MPSITTPPECPIASVVIAMVHAAFARSLIARPPGLKVSRPPLVRLRYGLVTRRHPSDGVVGRLQNLDLSRSCYPSYGAPTLTPVGLSPTERASLRWTHSDCFLEIYAPAMSARLWADRSHLVPVAPRDPRRSLDLTN